MSLRGQSNVVAFHAGVKKKGDSTTSHREGTVPRLNRQLYEPYTLDE